MARCQSVTWTNAGISSITSQRTYFNEILFEIEIFSFTKMQFQMSSAKCCPFCLGLKVLMPSTTYKCAHETNWPPVLNNDCHMTNKNSTYVCHYRLLTHLPLGQNGGHYADDILRCIFVNEKFCILIKISLKFVTKGPIDNYLALV